MRFLIYEWNTIGIKDLKDALRNKGYEIDVICYMFQNFEIDDSFTYKLRNILEQKNYDGVISFNFFQLISNVCNEMNIKYISWVFDSPTLNLYSKTIFNHCNYIFIFDKALYENINKFGLKHVYHLPLAANIERLNQIEITSNDIYKYKSDISFVGSLYDKNISYDSLSTLPDYYKGFLLGIMKAQQNIYGYNFLEELLTDEIINELKKYVYLKLDDNFIGSERMIFANTFLGVKITSLERNQILNMLSNNFNVNLYTNSDTKDLPHINNRGYIDYYTVMPKVFRLSKINLNITLRNIKTGIPLRVFDIMGAGGFVITNYQQELLDYFEDGKDLVIYESAKDLQDKIKYYLHHEDERKQIAFNGYTKVKELHNYSVRIDKILETVFDVSE